MIIGIDASRANRKFKGGTEWYSYYLIKELAKIDLKNQYVLYSDKPLISELCDLTAAETPLKEEDPLSGRCQKIKSPSNNFKVKILNWYFPFLWTQLRLSLEMLISPPDILFVPAHALPLIHPKKSLVTIHDIGFTRKKELYGTDLLGPSGSLTAYMINFLAIIFTFGQYRPNMLDYHNWSTKFNLKHAKKIIAVSGFTKKEIIEVYNSSPNKIEVIYNGYNNDLYRPLGADKKNALDLALNKYDIKQPYIFYVGRLEKKKNIARLINAFGIIKEKRKNIRHKLVLAGNAGLGFDEIKYVIEEFDLNNEVIITGWVPENDMPYLYSGAALFVFPSLYEGFGIPLVQAMALGIPIAASKTTAIPEITAGAAELFDPYDEYDIAEKMAKILLDKNTAAELIKQGKLRAKDFSMEKCARQTLAAIENAYK